MIYKSNLIVLNEKNLDYRLSDNFVMNLTDIEKPHGARIKVSGSGIGKEHSTSVPIKDRILTFEELLNDEHTYRMNKNGTGKYLEFIIGFVILNHGKLRAYVESNKVRIPSKHILDAINYASIQYGNEYKYNDIARIRRDSNEHVRLIRAGVIEDT